MQHASKFQLIETTTYFFLSISLNKITVMWCLVWGNVLGFSRMFTDSHVWLQITLGNQMPGESEFSL